MIRIAAVGDLHMTARSRGVLRPAFLALDGRADALLLAGDLTHLGKTSEAELLAEELRDVPVPIAAVLGNHDFHCGEAHAVRRTLEEIGVTVLEGESITIDVRGERLGIAGVKGFGGGFRGGCGHKFGEPEMKAFVQITEDAAIALEKSLGELDADYRVALLHYAPILDTLAGERLEILPFLGAYQLADALDRAGADLALHGHAHHGATEGATPAGIPVRNVAMPLIGQPYVIFELSGGADGARKVTVCRGDPSAD